MPHLATGVSWMVRAAGHGAGLLIFTIAVPSPMPGLAWAFPTPNPLFTFLRVLSLKTSEYVLQLILQTLMLNQAPEQMRISDERNKSSLDTGESL